MVERLGGFLNRLISVFASTYALNDEQLQKVIQYTGKLWWRVIQSSLRAGHVRTAARYHDAFRWSDQTRPPSWRSAVRWPPDCFRIRPEPRRRGRYRRSPTVL